MPGKEFTEERVTEENAKDDTIIVQFCSRDIIESTSDDFFPNNEIQPSITVQQNGDMLMIYVHISEGYTIQNPTLAIENFSQSQKLEFRELCNEVFEAKFYFKLMDRHPFYPQYFGVLNCTLKIAGNSVTLRTGFTFDLPMFHDKTLVTH